MNVGQTIRRLRLKKGWSQEELAHRVGAAPASISRIETGKHGISDQLKQSIAHEFGFKVSELLAMSEKNQSAPTASPPTKAEQDEEVLLHCFRKMGRDKKELLKNIGRIFATSK
ncbi:MAG: helix-turn-helix domain-containing protein [Gallionellaceae bacterium]|jgi:transcriptional regulator with XRE-family HTH domain|nr:helix-turn-helix domain-containing protein [Gallionellaceae bacterium]